VDVKGGGDALKVIDMFGNSEDVPVKGWKGDADDVGIPALRPA